MRIPIAVRVEPFDIEEAEAQLGAIRQTFVQYLSEVRRKSTRSKHGLMGPIGKVLSEINSGRRDPASLKGYALRVHEATGRISKTAVETLASGIDSLTELLAKTPVTAHGRIIDRLDYGLYFDLRKAAMESKEARRQAWIHFLRNKYVDERGLSEAWGEETSFDKLYLPSRAQGSTAKRANTRQRDVSAFWESQGFAGVVDEEEGEVE